MKTTTSQRGFTLIEVLVSATIIVIILGVLTSMTNQTQRLVRSTAGKVEQFSDARTAFEALTRRLAQATLNTYWGYRFETITRNVGGTPVTYNNPTSYERASELRFKSGSMNSLNGGNTLKNAFQPTHGVFFQSPNGFVDDPDKYGVLDDLLNTWGFFVEVNSDTDSLPPFLRDTVPSKRRFRLMEAMESSERLKVYDWSPSIEASNPNWWFQDFLRSSSRTVHPLSSNIIGLVLLPKLPKTDEDTISGGGNETSLTNDYLYDTRKSSTNAKLNSYNQLPPVIQVVMFAIDEASASRLDEQNPADPDMGIDFSGLFQNSSKLEADVAEFERRLTELGVIHRTFSTNVSIRGAKWSVNQTN